LSYKFAPGGFIDGGSTAVSPLAFKAPRAIAEYDWSGMFVGAHVGGGWQNVAFSDPSAFPVLTECCTSLSSTENPAAASNATGGGVLGGIQAGWMYQIQRLVVGSELDFSGTGIKGDGNNLLAAIPGATFFANEAYSVKTNWTATSTATIGLAKDNWLIYTKAGAAWADNRYALDVTGEGGFYFNPPPVPFSFAASTNKIVPGWTAGLGVKWAISHDLFLDAEYDMLDFGSGVQHISGVFTATPTGAISGASFSPNGTFDPVFNQIISEFKLGLNYKFALM
jgi:outer membrane immunogenic protein